MKTLLKLILIASCLFSICYYSIVFASNKLSDKADIEMHNAANQLKNYYKIHGYFPEEINRFLKENNIETTVNFWPFSTEIKVYTHQDDTCDIEYFQAPFGPLAGVSLNREEFYYSE